MTTAPTIELFAYDQANTTVLSGGTAALPAGTTETWTVASSAMFGSASSTASPPSQFHVADPQAATEVIAVTNTAGTVWTVTRGAENTTPVTHAAGFTVYQVTTAGFLGSVATLASDGHLNPTITPRPTLYGATGLRRFRAAFGDSLYSQIPIVCVGDSITAGQGGNNNLTSYSNIPDNTQGWVGQLRQLLGIRFAGTATVAGEGFIFADDSRVTWSGGTSNNNWPCCPLRHGPRLVHGSGNELAITIPSGVTELGVIQANQTQAFNSAGSNLADVSALYNQTGSVDITGSSITTLTNTGRAIQTNITCQSGDVITITPPGSAQSYIVGFSLQTGAAGPLVHRVGQPGYVSGDLLGGQLSGTLIQASSSSNQVDAARACYDWAQSSWAGGAGTTGLVIVSMGTNDQAFQAGGGTSNQNDVTLSLFTTWMTQFIAQAVTDGWSVLYLAEPRNPNGYSGGSSQDAYYQAIKSYALTSDYVAYLDIGEWWGSNADVAALGMGATNSVHPNRAGHGDIARMILNAITGWPGITELTAA